MMLFSDAKEYNGNKEERWRWGKKSRCRNSLEEKEDVKLKFVSLQNDQDSSFLDLRIPVHETGKKSDDRYSFRKKEVYYLVS